MTPSQGSPAAMAAGLPGGEPLTGREYLRVSKTDPAGCAHPSSSTTRT